MKDKDVTSAREFVLDCSVTMAWCFNDEGTSYTENILNSLKQNNAKVPTIWYLEVVNVLLIAERKKRITKLQSMYFMDNLKSLPIFLDNSTPSRAHNSIYQLARNLQLTSYDTAYLELASREQISLATTDNALRKAAHLANVEILKF